MLGGIARQPTDDYPAEPGFGSESEKEAEDDIEDARRLALYMRQSFHRGGLAPHDCDGEMPRPSDEPVDDMDVPEKLFDLEDATLLRGIDFGAVLSRRGNILCSSQPVQGNFQKSKPVEVLDAFLSHNWDTPWWSKFLCLCTHRNHGIAFMTVMLLASGIVLLDAADQLRYWERIRGTEIVKIGPWNTLLCTPCYWAVVLSDARRWLQCTRLGWSDACIFLDAACINQEDPQRRKQGIQAIPAFVLRSLAMIAVLTPLYLQKVWTVFELMTFIALRHTGKNLHVEPALLARSKFVGSIILFVGCNFFAGVQYAFPQRMDLLNWKFFVMGMPLLMVVIFLIQAIRAWGKELQGLRARAHDFDFDTALCGVEADRGLLRDAAATLPEPIFKKPARLERQFDKETGVESISTLVTSSTDNTASIVIEVERAIKHAVGRSGVPFRYLLGYIIPVMSGLVDSMSADLRRMVQGGAPIECLPQVVLRTCFNIVLFVVVLHLVCFLSVHRAPLVSLRSGTWRQRLEAFACWIVPLTALIAYVGWMQRSTEVLSATRQASLQNLLGVGIGFSLSLAVCHYMSSSPAWSA
eukprot:TRINITY_DN10535_c0_g1_i1.p1 TRINITY_DN10535_c0_g1~~TRINITY_DN10535_c0_g1_i1.p1  ORF type:complete len:581 (-),score=71.63 TRINITY_DN10535_c0_g1_i1:89-1831(-)